MTFILGLIGLGIGIGLADIASANCPQGFNPATSERNWLRPFQDSVAAGNSYGYLLVWAGAERHYEPILCFKYESNQWSLNDRLTLYTIALNADRSPAPRSVVVSGGTGRLRGLQNALGHNPRFVFEVKRGCRRDRLSRVLECPIDSIAQFAPPYRVVRPDGTSELMPDLGLTRPTLEAVDPYDSGAPQAP